MRNKLLTGELEFTSVEPCDLSTCSKRDITRFFENAYNIEESLFTALKDDSIFYKCPDRLRLPLIFYYGHSPVVYVNKLILSGLLKPEDRIDFVKETIFETGVDEMSWDDVEHCRMGGSYKWPPIDEVIEYRKQVRNLILGVIERTPLELPIIWESEWWELLMGIEHQRIHIETSSVLIRQLPIAFVQTPKKWIYGPKITDYPNNDIKDNRMIRVEAREVTLGKPVENPSYGWDNEYGRITIGVPEFESSEYLVTNKEFQDFVLSGGYETEKFWSKEGWAWVSYHGAKHPPFWICCRGCKSRCGGDLTAYSHCTPSSMAEQSEQQIVIDQNKNDNKLGSDQNFRLRCMFDVVEMPWNWPVEVNYLEAKAFCAWKGGNFRLLAEAEYQALRGTENTHESNTHLKFGSTTPVNMHPPNSLGFYDAAGNVWQWLEDNFNGLPGFKTHYLYDDYSTTSFDGKHNVMVGGSWVTTGEYASRFTRSAFRRHFIQHSGFRLARSNLTSGTNKNHQLPVRLVNTPTFALPANGTKTVDSTTRAVPIPENPFQLMEDCSVGCIHTDSMSTQILEETEEFLLESIRRDYSTDHVTRLLQVCQNWAEEFDIARDRAIHIGCETGAVVFELTESYKKVIGVDIYGSVIDVCLKLQSGEPVPTRNGALTVQFDNAQDNAVFKQFSWLPNEISFNDFVLFTMTSRVHNIRAWMARMRELVNRDGLLVIVSNSEQDTLVWDSLKDHFVAVDKHATLALDCGTSLKITAYRRQLQN